MADFDKLSDTKGEIINFIEKHARALLYQEVTSFDFSAWVQVALLFEQVIIPCRYYFPESLYELAQKVINIAKTKDCQVERYQEKDGKKVNVQIFDYQETINKIEQWLKEEKEFNESI
jgi:hypothetical protein